MKLKNGLKYLRLEGQASFVPGQPPWKQVYISDYKRYFAEKVTAMPPTMVKTKYDLDCEALASLRGVVLSLELARPKALALRVAEKGFCGLTLPLMHKLIATGGVEYKGRRPERERDAAVLLIRWQFPDITDEKLEEYLSFRDLKASKWHESVLGPENAELVEGMVAEDGVAEIKKATLTKVHTTSVDAPAMPPSSSAGSASSSSSGVAQPGELRPIAVKDHSVDEARQYCPEGAWIGIHTGRAWQVKYPKKPDYPKSHTITWGGGEPGISKHEAMLACLRWVWSEHTKLSKQACPWQLR